MRRNPKHREMTGDSRKARATLLPQAPPGDPAQLSAEAEVTCPLQKGLQLWAVFTKTRKGGPRTPKCQRTRASGVPSVRSSETRRDWVAGQPGRGRGGRGEGW